MDGDEIPDGVELRAAPPTDPFTSHRLESADSDGDGLCDYEETTFYRSSPNSIDSDGDGLLDGFEVRAGLNPTTGYSRARPQRRLNSLGQVLWDVIEQGPMDAEADEDGDGVDNLTEHTIGIDPILPDTDGDGITDGEEIATGANPADGLDGGEPDSTCWFMVTIGGHVPGTCANDPGTIGTDLRPINGVYPNDDKRPNNWTVHIGGAGAGGTGSGGRSVSTGPNGHRTIQYIPLRRGRCYDINLSFGGLVTEPGQGSEHVYFVGLTPVNMGQHDPTRGGPAACSACCCHVIVNPPDPQNQFPGGVLGNQCWLDAGTFPGVDGLTVRLCLPMVDLDVDSDNSEGLPGGFSYTTADERLEKHASLGQTDAPGMKVVLVNREDRDNDGIIDFADGFNRYTDTDADRRIAGIDDPATQQDESVIPQSFTPMALDVSGVPAELREGATVVFSYSAAGLNGVARTVVPKPSLDERAGPPVVHSYALDAQLLRIWRKGSDQERQAVDFVADGTPYPVSSFTGSGDVCALYVEAVGGSAAPIAIRATVLLSAAEGTSSCSSLSPEVRVLPLDPLTGIGSLQAIAGYTIARTQQGSSTVNGTAGKDILVGADNDNDHIETISGGEGDDIVLPGGGWDVIRPGPGQDVIYSWQGSKQIFSPLSDNDVISQSAGMVLGARPLTRKTSVAPSSHGTAGGSSRAQPFNSLDILQAYQWAFGTDDVWYEAFHENPRSVVKAVQSDGVWSLWSHWDADVIFERQDGEPGGIVEAFFIVKIQYSIGSSVDAAMGLRKAILEELTKDTTGRIVFDQHFEGRLSDWQTDAVTFDRIFTDWQAMRNANILYVAAAAEIMASLYYSLYTIVAGPGGELIDAIVTIPQVGAAAWAGAGQVLRAMPFMPGKSTNIERDPMGGNSSYLDCLVPPGGEPCGGGGVAPPDEIEPQPAGPLRAARLAVRAAGLIIDEVKDVVRFAVNSQGDASELGFVLRADMNSNAVVPNLQFIEGNGRRVALVGTAQAITGSPRHASTIERVAMELIQHGRLRSAPEGTEKQYLYIGMNRSTRTMCAAADDIPSIGKQAGDRLTANIERPDIIAVYWDPLLQRPQVEMFEVPSGGQNAAELRQKMQNAMNTLPSQYRTNVPLSNVVVPDP